MTEEEDRLEFAEQNALLKRQFDPFGVLNPGRMSEAH